MVDFSVNSNPFGPSPRVRRAIAEIDVAAYPDRACTRLRGALADANGVSVESVLVANGSAELVWLVAQAVVTPRDLVMIAGPTFGEYARAAGALGAEVREVRAGEPDFAVPVSEILRSVTRHRPRLLFLCNPNNPTGRALGAKEVSEILDACGGDTLLVLDEAYRTFVGAAPFAPPPGGCCVVLRSMTKDFAIAGLRLGYALGDPELLRRMERFQPAWSVNSAAQAAGAAALDDTAYYRETLTRLRVLSGELFHALRGLGVRLAPSDTHFAIARFDTPARLVRQLLLRRGIQVRDCASFGLPFHVRIA
ncbi:MAG TPA: histidinol-phosphate transaminase, partial [Spirochaetia bacterium]